MKLVLAMILALAGTALAQLNPNYAPYQTAAACTGCGGSNWTYSGSYTTDTYSGVPFFTRDWNPNPSEPPAVISTTSAGSEYEVRLKIVCCGDVVAYLRASTDANFYNDTGTFYAVRLTYSGITVYRRQSGTTTQLATAAVPGSGPNPGVLRAVIAGGELHVFYNDVWVIAMSESAITSGQPGWGLGSFGVVEAANYARETTAPSAGIPTSSVFPNRVDLQWGGSSDGAGIGVWQYLVFRNGSILGVTDYPAFSDTTASPSTTTRITCK